MSHSLTGSVIILCPGNLEAGGGIGRQMGYFLSGRGSQPEVSYRVIDSRGPWFLGASPFHTGLSVAYLAGAALKLVAARFSRGPVIVHVNITGRGSTIRKSVLVAVMRGIGLRYLLHIHDYDYAADWRGRGRFMRRVVKEMFHGAATIITLGSRDRKVLLETMGLAPDRVTVLPNAVPDPQPRPFAGQRETTPCHFLFLGHLSERKGVSELLRALASPQLAALGWRATLAGDGDVEKYRSLAADLGIVQRVEFTGWLDQDRIAGLCGGAHVLVLPSHAEGLAMAVLEGLSHGLAVITTPVGAHAEVIENGISGILIPPGDVEALADALRRVIEDADFRNRLGTAGRRRFLEKFEVTSYAKQLGNIHAALLAPETSCHQVAAT